MPRDSAAGEQLENAVQAVADNANAGGNVENPVPANEAQPEANVPVAEGVAGVGQPQAEVPQPNDAQVQAPVQAEVPAQAEVPPPNNAQAQAPAQNNVQNHAPAEFNEGLGNEGKKTLKKYYKKFGFSEKQIDENVNGPDNNAPGGRLSVRGQVGGNRQPQVIGNANEIPGVVGNGQPQQQQGAGQGGAQPQPQPAPAQEGAQPQQQPAPAQGGAQPQPVPAQVGAQPQPAPAQVGAQPQPQPQPANAAVNNPNPANPPPANAAQNRQRNLTRFDVLKTKLIDKHKEEKDELEQKKADNQMIKHSKTPGRNNMADKLAGYADKTSLVATLPQTLAGVADFGVGTLGLLGNVDAAGTLGSKYMDFSQSENTQNALNTMSAVGNGIGIGANLMKYGSNRYRAKHDKNRNHRIVAEMRKKRDLFATVRSASSMFGNLNNLGTFGGKPMEHTGQMRFGGITDVVSGVAGFGKTLYDFKANRKKKALHAQTASNTGAIYRRMLHKNVGAQLDDTDAQIKTLNDELSGAGSLKGAINLATQRNIADKRQRRHTLKAQKYAMEMAMRLHDRKSKGKSKGVLGMIGASFGLAGSVLTGISKTGLGKSLGLLSTAGGALSGIGGAVGSFLGDGIVENVTGKRRGNKLKADQIQIAKEYIEKKIKSVETDAQGLNDSLTNEERDAIGGGRLDALTDKEKRRIAVMRIGQKAKFNKPFWKKILFKPASDDADLDEETYLNVFQALVEKRANNIMQASPEARREMFNALGLDADASIEDVMAAINPNDTL